MADAMHRAFFGDAERNFVLTGELVLELERVTGAGIGSLCKRLFAGDFKHAEIFTVIRLALIGGGEKPQAALALAMTYGASRPLGEIYPLAVSILELLWFGPAKEEPARADD